MLQSYNRVETPDPGVFADIRWDLSLTGRSLIHNLEQSHAEQILREFGGLIPQDEAGTVRYQVKSTASGGNLSSSKSANALNPHTEASYLPNPPHLLALFCLRAAECGGGQTLLADGYAMLQSLEPDERDAAMHERIWFGDPTRPMSYVGPVFQPNPPTSLRFSYNLLRHRLYDPETAQILAAGPAQNLRETLADTLLVAFQRCHEAIDIPAGALLIVDNRRMVHGRTAYSDHRRELIRYWIQ